MSFDSGTFILPLIYRPVILDADGRRRIYGESVNFGDKMPGNLNRKSSGRLDPAGKNPKFLCSPRTRPWWWGMRDRAQGSSESNLTLTLRGEGEEGNVIRVSRRSANPPQLTLTDWHQVGVLGSAFYPTAFCPPGKEESWNCWQCKKLLFSWNQPKLSERSFLALGLSSGLLDFLIKEIL